MVLVDVFFGLGDGFWGLFYVMFSRSSLRLGDVFLFLVRLSVDNF